MELQPPFEDFWERGLLKQNKKEDLGRNDCSREFGGLMLDCFERVRIDRF